jgi:acetolactate synthase regulatory subunit
VVSHYGTGGVAPTTDAGPTVERALEVVRSHGFNVRLATVS